MKPAFLLLFSWALVATFVVPCTAAGLKWEVRERKISTTAGGENVAVKYPFVNTGTAAVSITAIDTGCVCTSAKASKNSYAPGESGELAVEFAIGGRVGRQDRLLTVTTSEPGAQPQELRLIVEIAELVSLRPRLIFWAVGDTAVEKIVTISLARPDQTKLQAPTSSTTDFTARVEATEQPGIFHLHVTPASVSTAVNSVVRIDAMIDGKIHSLTVFAAVR